MDTEKVLEQLNVGLELQLRSLLQFTQASGSMFGIEVQGVADKLWDFAQHELEDTRLLVEKITALGGDPTTKVGELKWQPDPAKALDHLIETEDEVTEALHAVIPHSGQEAQLGGARAPDGAHHHAQAESDRLAAAGAARAMSLQHVSLELRDATTSRPSIASGRCSASSGSSRRAAGRESRRGCSATARRSTCCSPTSRSSAARGHVAVVAEDWDAAFAPLRDAGFEPEEHARHWGAARAFVHTPAGHVVEVMAAPPAVGGSRTAGLAQAPTHTRVHTPVRGARDGRICAYGLHRPSPPRRARRRRPQVRLRRASEAARPRARQPSDLRPLAS